jgi:hypothetical protein
MEGCYRCGSAGGSDLQLCPVCSEAYNKKREALKKNLRVNTDPDADSFLHRFFCDGRFQANVLVLLWYLFTFALVLMGIEVGIPMEVSILIGTLVTSIGLFFITLLLSWLSLMIFDRLQGIIALIFPPMLYRLFIRMWRFRFITTEWESHKGVVLAHVVSFVVSFVGINAISAVGDEAIFRADRKFRNSYGFSPARCLIVLGLVSRSSK